MSVEHPDQVQWEKVAAELHSARETQQRTWGDIDNATLGRYLADEASSSERAEIETAFETLPELKLLTDLVRDVLADSAPAKPVAPVRVATVAARSAATLPFQRPVPVGPKARWIASPQRAAVLVAACLFLALGAWLFGPGLTKEKQPAPDLQSLGDAQAHLNRSQLVPENHTPSPPQPPVELALAEIDKLQREIEVSEKKGDYENALAAADQFFAVTEQNRSLDNNLRAAPQVAKGLNQVGLLYSKEGYIDQAERALAKANDINLKTLGENHAATRQTSYYLAGVYQDGVARRGEPTATGAGRVAPMAMAMPTIDAKDKGQQSRDASLAEFRKRMNNPEMQNRVRTAVVPVLTKALQDARSAPERTRLAVALGNLGTLAHDAAPAVEDCLAQAKDAHERFALVVALNQMGPPSDRAVPVLVETFKQCEAQEVRRSVASYLAQAPAGKVQLDELAANGKADEKKCAREALQRTRGGR